MQEVTLLLQSTKEPLVHRSTQVMAAGIPHMPKGLLLLSLIIRSK